jgi:hypothetical protein
LPDRAGIRFTSYWEVGVSFYVRKSLRAGPFRFNLSRSGIGVSAGIPGFRVGGGPRGNYVRVDVAGVHYQTSFSTKQRGRSGSAPQVSPAAPSLVPSDVIMLETTGTDATRLEPTGPGDLVEQLNGAGRRHLWWPWVAAAVVIVAAVSGVGGLVVLPLGAVGVVWLALWERARRTAVAFYDVTGPAATWFQGLVDGYPPLVGMAGAWRIQASGAVTGTHQYKINSGASNVVSRVAASFTLAPRTTLVTNIAVPSVRCGRDALLFLPDRVLVCSGRSWSDVAYGELRVSMNPTRFIESGEVPRDGTRIGSTWQYVTSRVARIVGTRTIDSFRSCSTARWSSGRRPACDGSSIARGSTRRGGCRRSLQLPGLPFLRRRPPRRLLAPRRGSNRDHRSGRDHRSPP